MRDAEKSINTRIADGAFWTVLMRLGIRALGVVSIIVLARILVPEDFGVVAKASMIASFLEMVTQFGLDTALIQNQAAKRRHYDSVWTIHVIRGAAIAICLVILSEPAATFLNEPELDRVLLYFALASFISGFENVGIVNFRKDLTFDRDFGFNISKKLAGFVATVSAALLLKSYWAFVIGSLSASVVGLLVSYVMSNYRPRFSLEELRSLFDFSKWIFLMSIVNAISIKIDTLILSRLSTTQIVGKYTVAYEIAGSASTEIAMPIARATMPGLAKLYSELDEFRATYTSSILLVMLVVLPAALGLSVLSESITHVLLGEKWADAAILIEILALFGVFRAVYSVSASAFMASGEVKRFSLLSALNLLLRIVILIAGFLLGGAVGLAWGVLVSSIIFNAMLLLVQNRLGFVRWSDLGRGVWRNALASLLMYAALVYATSTFDGIIDLNTLPNLLIFVVSGMVIYVSSLTILNLVSNNNEGPEMVVLEFLKSKVPKRS